ncbi:MAG: MFS transporter [Actinomycetota bacterium]
MRPDPRRWYVLGVCAGGLFLVVAGVTALSVALPDLERSLGADAADLQWIVDSYAVVFGGLLLTGGAIGDRIGRRPALLIGFLLFGLGGLVGGVVDSVDGVIVARVVSGLGAAMLMPATLSTLTEVFDEDEVPQAIAWWAGVAGGGSALGPVMAGWLLEVSSWRAVFLANAVGGAAGIIAVLVVVPKLAPATSGRLDLGGAVLSTVTIGATLFAVIEAPGHWTDPMVLAAVVIAIAGLIAFIGHERRTPVPMIPARAVASPRLRTGAATLVLTAVGFAGVVFVASLLLQFAWDEGPLVTGLVVAPIGVVELLVASRVPQLGQRFGINRVISYGIVLMSAGYVGMALTPIGEHLLFVAAGVVAGVGNGLVIPASIDRVIGDADPEMAGVVAGINETSIELGASLGIAILGSVQRVAFRNELDVDVDSFTEGVEAVGEQAAAAAYDTSAGYALIVGAVIVAAALPFARRDLESACVTAPPPGEAAGPTNADTRS